MKKFYRAKELAPLLGIAPSTIWRIVEKGALRKHEVSPRVTMFEWDEAYIRLRLLFDRKQELCATVKEISEEYNIRLQTLWLYIRQNKIKTYKKDYLRFTFIYKKDMDEFIRGEMK